MSVTSILIKILIKTKQTLNPDMLAHLMTPEFCSRSKVEGRFFQGQFYFYIYFSNFLFENSNSISRCV
jgi:hypothetical protein